MQDDETRRPLEVAVPSGGYARSSAIAAVRDAPLRRILAEIAPGPFGLTAVCTAVLESLIDAVDVGMATAAALEGLIRSELTSDGSFETVSLEVPHRRLIAALQIVATCDDAARRIERHCPTPQVQGTLEVDGVDALFDVDDSAALARRICAMAGTYLQLNRGRHDARASSADVFAGTTVAAALLLLRRTVETFARSGTMRPMLEALGARSIRIAGFPYDGLKVRPATETPSGLLPIQHTDIVGNHKYVEAGLRLARDVAGFDRALGKNPKRINPVLFGLGSPGCGKTVTAHAIGNYFLEYCRQRSIPARFLVVRRSDWASSYQNASAANLIRIFREEVYAFDGVCGVYWPDIDTALASRASSGLRMEEKQNLGAVFGVFDGTLLPKDGKWFLICDANTMHMDEAAISRIAQNPFTVAGPTTPEHYARLMRELMLRDVASFVPNDAESWKRIGTEALMHGLSGRAIESVCGNIRAEIQDFEFPDEYFEASGPARQAIIDDLSKPVDEAFIVRAMAEWVKFKRDAAKREERERFDSEVETVVRQLNAGRAAMERAEELGLTSL